MRIDLTQLLGFALPGRTAENSGPGAEGDFADILAALPSTGNEGDNTAKAQDGSPEEAVAGSASDGVDGTDPDIAEIGEQDLQGTATAEAEPRVAGPPSWSSAPGVLRHSPDSPAMPAERAARAPDRAEVPADSLPRFQRADQVRQGLPAANLPADRVPVAVSASSGSESSVSESRVHLPGLTPAPGAHPVETVRPGRALMGSLPASEAHPVETARPGRALTGSLPASEANPVETVRPGRALMGSTPASEVHPVGAIRHGPAFMGSTPGLEKHPVVTVRPGRALMGSIPAPEAHPVEAIRPGPAPMAGLKGHALFASSGSIPETASDPAPRSAPVAGEPNRPPGGAGTLVARSTTPTVEASLQPVSVPSEKAGTVQPPVHGDGPAREAVTLRRDVFRTEARDHSLTSARLENPGRSTASDLGSTVATGPARQSTAVMGMRSAPGEPAPQAVLALDGETQKNIRALDRAEVIPGNRMAVVEKLRALPDKMSDAGSTAQRAEGPEKAVFRPQNSLFRQQGFTPAAVSSNGAASLPEASPGELAKPQPAETTDQAVKGQLHDRPAVTRTITSFPAPSVQGQGDIAVGSEIRPGFAGLERLPGRSDDVAQPRSGFPTDEPRGAGPTEMPTQPIDRAPQPVRARVQTDILAGAMPRDQSGADTLESSTSVKELPPREEPVHHAGGGPALPALLRHGRTGAYSQQQLFVRDRLENHGEIQTSPGPEGPANKPSDASMPARPVLAPEIRSAPLAETLPLGESRLLSVRRDERATREPKGIDSRRAGPLAAGSDGTLPAAAGTKPVSRAAHDLPTAGGLANKVRVTAPDIADPAPDLDDQAGTALHAAEMRAPIGGPASVAALTRGIPPHPVMQQLADALPPNGNGSVEITLNPEELGRVRMTLSSGEAGLSVHIQADRPETLDLLRRNIDQLARDLAQMGQDAAAFTFGGGHREDAHRRHGLDTPPTTSVEGESMPEQPSPRDAPAGDGLDIRL